MVWLKRVELPTGAMQRGNELGPGGMVLHLVGIGLGVGQHIAGGVDDGDARVGSARDLRLTICGMALGGALSTREANIWVFCRSEVSISLRSMPSQARRMSTSMVRECTPR